MKKLIFLSLVAILTIGLLIGGCAEPEEAPAPTAPPETPAPEKPAPEKPLEISRPPAGEPVYGGTMVQIASSGPAVLGYFPKMWVMDEIAMMPAVERMMDYNADQEIIPWLAESWEPAADGKSITIKLRKGIKFTDGSDFNAEVAAWNYQLGKDTKRIQNPDKLLSIDIVDDYTIRLNTTEYTPLIPRFWGWYPMFSKEAFEKNGEEWCIANCVATGPFMVGEYKRDDYLKFVKNPNYWQSGKPYLDAILVRIIPDPVTASAMMQKGEADWWGGTPPQYQKELEDKGFVRQINPKYGGPSGILANNMPDSRFSDKRLREAIEYAIDKKAMADALGFGYTTPLTSVYPAGTWGHIDEELRPYNPEKARELIADAGYPDGLMVTLLTTMAGTDAATAIKQFLDDVGMTVEIDIADFGRYFGMAFTDGWQDLILYGWGVDPNTFVSMHCHWGPEPLSNPVSLYRPPEFVDMAMESLTKLDEADLIEYTKKMERYIKDETLVIPLTYTPSAIMLQPYVHTTYLQEMMVSRHAEHEWVDPH